MATIHYGFDPVEEDLPEGQWFLDPLFEQSDWAPQILELFEENLLSDREYVARLERHYHAFRAALAVVPPRSRIQAPPALRASSREAPAAYSRSRNQRKRERRRAR